MICKWCGAEMDRNDLKCRRCGKETPALSDCGGFYDLVPQVAPRSAAAPVRKPQKKGSLFAFICVLLAIALAVSILFCLKLSGEKRELAQEVEELEEQLEANTPTGAISDLLPGKDEDPDPEATDLELPEPEETVETEPQEDDEDKKEDKKSGKE